MINDEMLRYIHFKYYQLNYNYSRDSSEYKKEVFEIEGKNCEASDFGASMERNEEIMKIWKGFSLICPDFK